MFHRLKSSVLTLLLASCLLILTMTPAVYGAGTGNTGTSTATAPGSIDATALANVPVVSKDGITSFQGMQVVNVKNTNDQNSDYMWVIGILSSSTKLPAKVRIAVPKGAAITWMGEMDTQTGAEQAFAPSKPTTQGDQDFYTVTMTKYSMMRAEFPTKNPFKGSTAATATAVMAAELSYKPPCDLMFLSLGAEVPANRTVISPDFKDGGQMPSGNHMYLADIAQPKAGQTYKATLKYGKPGAAKDATSPLVIIAVVALVVAVAALLFIVLRKRFGDVEEAE
ncbi:MAG: hypothetical protein FWD65_04545 [Coriobacteriia bacterium]|nr:hypothetical protein [Coriobacteriia bacterium]